MKTVVRAFFKTLRVILGPFMLLGEFVTRPKAMSRPAANQAKVEQQCASIVLYQYKTCPFCIKVRQEMRRLALNVQKLDAQQPGTNRDDLVRGGGKAKVPCLKITDPAGKTQWLYESGERSSNICAAVSPLPDVPLTLNSPSVSLLEQRPRLLSSQAAVLHSRKNRQLMPRRASRCNWPAPWPAARSVSPGHPGRIRPARTSCWYRCS